MLKALTQTKNASARVVDGALVLSLPNAVQPVVWRMELGHAKASAMELRELAGGQTDLTLISQRGEERRIATFDHKGDALAALMKISKALHGAKGTSGGTQTAAPAAPHRSSPLKSALKWFGALAAVLLVVFIFTYLVQLTPAVYDGADNAATSNGAAAGNGGSSEAGLPESADAFLQGM